MAVDDVPYGSVPINTGLPPTPEKLVLPLVQVPHENDMAGIVAAIIALKERVEAMQRQLGDQRYWVPTYQELVSMGVITSAQIPTKR